MTIKKPTSIAGGLKKDRASSSSLPAPEVRTWKCDDCGVIEFVDWSQAILGSRMCCRACGSYLMRPVSKQAKADQAGERRLRDECGVVEPPHAPVGLGQVFRSPLKPTGA